MRMCFNEPQSNANIIRINRGDTFIMPIFINCGTNLAPKRYYLDNGDRVYFGVMEPNKLFENSIIKKVFDKESKTNKFGDIILELRPEDTQFLLPGTYYYMVKLRQLDENTHEYVTTVIPKTLFYIV